MDFPITLEVNGASYQLTIDTRTTLLDALRENLGFNGPKKAVTTGSVVPAPFCLMVGVSIAAWRLLSRIKIARLPPLRDWSMVGGCTRFNRHSSRTMPSSVATARRDKSARRLGCCARLRLAGPVPRPLIFVPTTSCLLRMRFGSE